MTYVGGKNKNRHMNKRGSGSQPGRSLDNKIPVVGVVQRGGKVAALVTKDASKASITRRAHAIVRDYSLKPLDNVHIATAIEQGISILETYDGDMITRVNGKKFEVEGRELELTVRNPVWEEPVVVPDPQMPLPLDPETLASDEDASAS